jgi:hypothetical protein
MRDAPSLGGRVTSEQDAVRRARELLTFADGVEEAGLVRFAQKSRVVARDALDLAEQLSAERSARVAMQAARDRCLALLMARISPSAADVETACAA